MNPPLHRKFWATKLAAIAAVLLLIAAIVDATVVEPRWLEVTHHTTRIGVHFPLKIAHVSDLHLHAEGFIEQSVTAALIEEAPDIIVITGDLYDTHAGKDAAVAFLPKLTAPLGVWYVPGNWEHWTQLKAGDSFLPTTHVQTLLNSSVRVRDDVWLAGFDDAYAGTPRFEAAVATVPADVALVGLFHSPAFFAEAEKRVSLGLAGHTHGGQVRLPFVGALWLPPGSGPYVAGWYRGAQSSLFVSRGIGTSILPIRFGCRPELAIITALPLVD